MEVERGEVVSPRGKAVHLRFRAKGVIPPVVTPFVEDGTRVDVGALERLCDFLIERGVHGLFALGTTGEGASLCVEERKTVAERVVRCVHGRVPVLIHAGAVTTAMTVELARHARAVGADAASVIFPYYYRHNERDVIGHYQQVAGAVPDFPIYLYFGRNALSPEGVHRVRASAPNVVGMKDSTHSYDMLMDYLGTLGEDFSVLEGHESFALGGLVMGTDGMIAALATVFPEPLIELYDLFQKGNYEGARVQQFFINRLQKVVYGEAPYARIKQALAFRGVNVGPPRPPLAPCAEEEARALHRALEGLGVL